MDSELTPLLDDPTATAALRADLGIAKTAVVQGFDPIAGLATLQAALAGQAAVGTTAAASTSLLSKVVIGVVVAGGAAAAWLATRPEPAPVVEREPVAIVEPAPAAAAPQAHTPEPAVAPVEVPEEEDEPTVIEDELDAPTKVRRREPKAAAKAPAPSLEERLLEEARTIADARSALGSDPARALSLTQQAATRFPDGQLGQEREALRIRALAKLGRTDEAKSRADTYLRRYPRGPHADAVRQATGS